MAKKKIKGIGIDEGVWELLVKATGKRMVETGECCSMAEIAEEAIRDYVKREEV